jgi:hypothetical protein
VNFHFWLYARYLRSFFPFLIFVAIYGLILRKLAPKVIPQLHSFFFGKPFDRGADSDLNRVRPAREFVDELDFVMLLLWTIFLVVDLITWDYLPVRRIRSVLVYFTLFLLSSWLNLFRWVVVITNLFLLLPGLCLHPKVHEGIGFVVQTVRKRTRKKKEE